jgi:hypothetical protein
MRKKQFVSQLKIVSKLNELGSQSVEKNLKLYKIFNS